MELKDFWAKTEPFQSVVTHGLVSGRIAQALVRVYLSAGTKGLLCSVLDLDGAGLAAFVGYLVSLHDIGKIEYSFQTKDPEMRERLRSDPEFGGANSIPLAGVRHERTGQFCLDALWTEAGEDEDAKDLFASVIGAHHPGKSGRGNFKRKSKLFEYQKAYEALMREKFLPNMPNALPLIREGQDGVVGAEMLSLLTLSDWIASGPAFADAESWIRQDHAEEIVSEKTDYFLRCSGLGPQNTVWPTGFCALWPWIPTNGQRPLQRETEALLQDPTTPFSLILLEAPMGEGKTEAGLYAAIRLAAQWQKDGFYVALPTAATANQMVGRVRDLMAAQDQLASVRLLHGMAWLDDTDDLRPRSRSDEDDGIANWLAPIRRGLLGQYAVGTIDQAMLAATTVKYGSLRLLGLSNKVLVIDEIHSFDAYMSEIIHRLLEWCKAMQIPVVMLSATLPPEKKKELFAPYTSQPLSKGYPLITAITSDGKVVEKPVPETTHHMSAAVSLIPVLNDPERIAETAAEAVCDGGCLCVLMNTVKEAQAVYSALKQRYTGDLLLFHAQFPAGRRAEIEKSCILRYGKDKSQRPVRSILVATQVVEQSLDVDFDVMYTAVAPIDLLIQRLGRVHRHAETQRPAGMSRPFLGVLIPAENEGFGSGRFVYPECLLRRSVGLLRETREIRVPEDVAELVRRGYDPAEVPPEELLQWQENLIKEQVEAGASEQFLLNPPDRQFNALVDTIAYDDENGRIKVATRLGEPTTRIALTESALFEKLRPFLKTVNGATRAAVWNKELAEQIMLRSVAVADRRLGKALPPASCVYGDKLLAGILIIRLDGGSAPLGDGKRIWDDPELGVLIKEGEV